MLQLTLLLATVMWSPAAAAALRPINITLERGEVEFDRMLMNCKNSEVASFWKEMLLKQNKSTQGKVSPQTSNSSKVHLRLHLIESTSESVDREMRHFQGALYTNVLITIIFL